MDHAAQRIGRVHLCAERGHLCPIGDIRLGHDHGDALGAQQGYHRFSGRRWCAATDQQQPLGTLFRQPLSDDQPQGTKATGNQIGRRPLNLEGLRRCRRLIGSQPRDITLCATERDLHFAFRLVRCGCKLGVELGCLCGSIKLRIQIDQPTAQFGMFQGNGFAHPPDRGLGKTGNLITSEHALRSLGDKPECGWLCALAQQRLHQIERAAPTG